MLDAALSVTSSGLRIVEDAERWPFVLRLGRNGEHAMATFAAAFGAPLPLTPNTTSGSTLRLYWLAPNEWAVVVPSESVAGALPGEVAKASADVLHNLSEQAWSAFAIEGANARKLLAKGCSLDLHPRAFALGACAQTLLAHAPVLIERTGSDGFCVYIDRSFAAYLRLWIEDAALEFTGTMP
jgi:sarcosine oxidase, subunit gamma